MMIIVMECIVALTIIAGLAFFQTPLRIWLSLLGVSLLFFTVFSHFSWTTLLILWFLFIALASLLSIKSLRYAWLSGPILRFFRSALPVMSETERIALEAGEVWWDGDLFSGRPDWERLHKMKKPSLTKVETAFINDQVETLCNMLDDWHIVKKEGDLPANVWKYIKKEGFWGFGIPKKFGGKEFSALAQSAIVTKLATRSVSVAVTVMVPNTLGPAELLFRYGTEEQKKYYLPRLASGKEVPCFGLTAPEAGSDASAIPDTGIVCKGTYKGKKITGIRLTWDKRYITLAPVATVLGLAFKLYDPEHLIGEEEDIGITLCLIPTSHPGVEIGERHDPLYLAFMNGPTRGKDVFIPLDWIIGGIEGAGQGWHMLMESLAAGRGISLPALSTGLVLLCYRMTGAYAHIRKQFNLPIAKFEGIEELLGRIGGYTYMLEACRLLTASAVSHDVKPAVVSAIAKYHMTELSRQVINDAMDIHAGRGIQLGPRNYLGIHYCSIPISITVEGANVLTRNLIIFGQGAARCHPYIHREMQAIAEDKPLEKFDTLLMSHMGYTISNLARSFIYGITGGYFIRKPRKNITGKYYQQCTRMSTALAFVSDITMVVLGGTLKRKERLSARLGDVLSNLYLASAVLKYFDDQNKNDEDIPYMQWSLQVCLYNIQIAFDEFFMNFPNRFIGSLLRFIAFPLGRSYKKPKDKISHQIAQHMIESSSLRDRLTKYCHVGARANDVTGRIEQALKKRIAADPIDKKLQEAIKKGKLEREVNLTKLLKEAVKQEVLTEKEAGVLREAERACLDAIAVDDFPFDFLSSSD